MEAIYNKDFVSYLQDELIRRCETNPRYSLRAFARCLKTDPSFLSKLIHRKRALTLEVFQQYSEELGLDPNAKEYFYKKMKEPSTKPFTDYTQLTMDQFQIISDWYHYAILELIGIEGFKGEPRWIAKKLGITVLEVNAAVDRLLRLEYISISKKGVWKNISGAHTTVHINNTSGALRKYQNQVLKLAGAAMENIPIELRDQSTMVMSINLSDLPKAKEFIKKFRRELCTLMEKRRKLTEVYQLSVSFFPLTTIKKGSI